MVFLCPRLSAFTGQKRRLVTELGVYVAPASEVYLVSDTVSISIELAVQLPTVDVEKFKLCNNDTTILETLKKANEAYKLGVQATLGLTDTVETNVTDSTATAACAEAGQCTFKPRLVADSNNRIMVPISCGKINEENVDNCGGLDSTHTICCPLESAQRKGPCLQQGVSSALHSIVAWRAVNPRAKVHAGSTRLIARKLAAVCITKVSEIRNGKIVKLGDERVAGSETDENGRPVHLVYPLGRRRRSLSALFRQRRAATRIRRRRSNLAYYLRGGFLTSGYIDSQIKRVKNAEKLSEAELKEQLTKQEAQILSLSSGKKVLDRLQSNVCSSTEKITEDLIKTEFKLSQDELFTSTELAIAECEATGTAPAQVPTSVLETVCQHYSQSGICYTLKSRNLFSCKLSFIDYDSEEHVIRVVLDLQHSIPVSQTYEALRADTLFVYADANFPRTSTKSVSTTKSTTTQSDEDSKILKKLANLLRSRRETEERDTPSHFSVSRMQVPSFLFCPSTTFEAAGKVTDVHPFTQNGCEKRGSVHLCQLDRTELSMKECGLALLRVLRNETNSNVHSTCTVEHSLTTSRCLVKAVDGQYLLSTNKPIEISKPNAKAGKDIFNKKINGGVCDGVCLVSNSEENAFTCGGQAYSTHVPNHKKVDIKLESISTNIRLSGLKRSDLNPSDLLLSQLSSSFNNYLGEKQQYSVLQTISKIMTLVSAFWWTAVVLFFVSRCVYRKLYLLRRKRGWTLPDPGRKRSFD